MGDREPQGNEWICRRCGSVQDGSVSVCPECGSPSTPESHLVPTDAGRRERSGLDWTAILLAILTALVIVLLALSVQF